MDAILAREDARWERLSTTQKITDFVTRHEYGVILGSWAMAMTGAFAYIMRDPCVILFLSRLVSVSGSSPAM